MFALTSVQEWKEMLPKMFESEDSEIIWRNKEGSLSQCTVHTVAMSAVTLRG